MEIDQSISAQDKLEDYFGEAELQEHFNKLKVYDNLQEALTPELYSASLKIPEKPQDIRLKKLLASFPKGAYLHSLTIQEGNKQKGLSLIDIPANEKSARIVIVLDNEQKKRNIWPLNNFIVVDKDNGKAIDVTDIFPKEWQIKYHQKEDPRKSTSETSVYLGPVHSISAALFGKKGYAIEASAHEIGHVLSHNEEMSRFDQMSFKGALLALLLQIPILNLPTLPIALVSKDYHQVRRIGAFVERKATAIGIRLIRKMRQLGVDPLPKTSNEEIIKRYKEFLFTKDIIFPGKRIFSR